MPISLFSICDQFAIEGNFQSAKPFDRGLINDTSIAAYEKNGKIYKYICQRINSTVFHNPQTVMENISKVTKHINSKSTGEGRQLILQDTKNDMPYHIDEEGHYWRMYNFIPNSTTYNVAESTQQAFEAAYAFGSFQEKVSELDPSTIHQTIKHFHNTPIRYQNFQKALDADVKNRAIKCKDLIDALQSREGIADTFMKLGREGHMPDRISHNDTKLNNVLFDKTSGRAICVIDLDTVMPGQSLFDFGDLIRTATSPVDEDEVDTSKIKMQMPLFEAIVQGYWKATKAFLTPVEKEHLAFSGKLITYEVAMRFLTDYLEGDNYFKISYENQNRNRSKAQLAMVESIERQEEQMVRIIEAL